MAAHIAVIRGVCCRWYTGGWLAKSQGFLATQQPTLFGSTLESCMERFMSVSKATRPFPFEGSKSQCRIEIFM